MNDSISVSQYLTDNAEVNARAKNGRTALMEAARAGSFDTVVVSYILKRKRTNIMVLILFTLLLWCTVMM